MIDLVADFLLDAISQARPRWTDRARVATDWLRDVARPPRGVQLVSDDGSTYSGVAVIERSELVMLLAVRHAPGPNHYTSRVTREPEPRVRPQYSLSTTLDPDDPCWDRDTGLRD